MASSAYRVAATSTRCAAARGQLPHMPSVSACAGRRQAGYAVPHPTTPAAELLLTAWRIEGEAHMLLARFARRLSFLALAALALAAGSAAAAEKPIRIGFGMALTG